MTSRMSLMYSYLFKVACRFKTEQIEISSSFRVKHRFQTYLLHSRFVFHLLTILTLKTFFHFLLFISICVTKSLTSSLIKGCDVICGRPLKSSTFKIKTNRNVRSYSPTTDPKIWNWRKKFFNWKPKNRLKFTSSLHQNMRVVRRTKAWRSASLSNCT